MPTDNKFKIIVDENMPYAETLFQRMGEVQLIRGREITRESLQQTDALMVRSVTPVGSELLQGTPIQFVGSATAGTDHIDISWLNQQKIHFSSAAGCNAIAVVEYVFSALFVMSERQGFCLQDKTVGIIGVGHIGSLLYQRLNALGVRTLLCDPPRASQTPVDDPVLKFWPFETLVNQADILTFHTPLNETGLYKTLHLVDDDVLAALPENKILINTCRGKVIDNRALLKALERKKKLRAVLDVWDPEPEICLKLLALVDIGTPHIAGYTLEGKARGTLQIFSAFSQFLNQPQIIDLNALLASADFNLIQLNAEMNPGRLKQLIHLVYDVRRDDALLRKKAGIKGGFDDLRKHYQERREWSSFCVESHHLESRSLLQKLGFSVSSL